MHFLEIETNRLLLKGLTTEDMTSIFTCLPKEEIKKVLGHRTEEEYQKEEYKQINGYASYNRRFLLFLLTEKTSGQIIGRCGLHNWNVEHRRAEIGYNISDENFKRKGFMSEAVEAIVEYGFKELNLNRIEALVGVGNVPSLRLMEKNKFIREGQLRQHYPHPDGFEDSVLFSKLQAEHRAERS
ncbi:MAG: hypothetical protein A3D92_22465 [Bacteroidetes bacterium RIFCSPHIGHO2_02_FULL_44_7]|nr:MAG: hypothetical protein A3D92_22465 [Bacteroidetes bacterium RIFCSPHIGHO2_02_FULL_44_7]